MTRCLIDHITVTAPSLAMGARFVQSVLGVFPQTGGEHPRMGTHNLLLRLGDAVFLEVISANPLVPPPGRPRWFALDSLGARSAPSLATWVVRTADINKTLADSSESLGNVEPMARGSLNWLISIPPDGSLPLQGVAPAIIQWQCDVHPASRLPDHGLSLVRLELFDPDPERIRRLLRSLALEAPVSVTAGSSPRLVAHINTRQGLRYLSAANMHNPTLGREVPFAG